MVADLVTIPERQCLTSLETQQHIISHIGNEIKKNHLLKKSQMSAKNSLETVTSVTLSSLYADESREVS